MGNNRETILALECIATRCNTRGSFLGDLEIEITLPNRACYHGIETSSYLKILKDTFEGGAQCERHGMPQRFVILVLIPSCVR